MTRNNILIDGALTVPGAAVTLVEKSMRGGLIRRGALARERAGQTAVEYLMTTLFLTIAFSGMYGFMQGQLKTLFRAAAIKILTSYY